jgi:hypothetical protein
VSGGYVSMVAAIKANQPDVLEGILSQTFPSRLIFGLDSSTEGLLAYHPKDHPSDVYMEGFRRLLKATANSLGVMAVRNPESQERVEMEAETMVSMIERKLGCTLTHNGCGGVPGMIVGDRFIPHKLLDAALTIATARRQYCWPPTNVLEIGAGAGWIGYLLNRLGIPKYHTIDLPTVSVMQAYMLAAATSPKEVWLSGEERSGNHSFFIHGLSEEPGWSWIKGYFQLAINQNSFPEITPGEQTRLVAILERVVQAGDVFLSINHESSEREQSRVFDAMSASKEFKLIQRSPHWAREGYVEEVWRHL